jgi:hypothetical protein
MADPVGPREGVEDVHRLFAGHREDVRTTLFLEALDEQASGGPASMRRDHAGECTGGSGAAGLLAGLPRPSEAADRPAEVDVVEPQRCGLGIVAATSRGSR